MTIDYSPSVVSTQYQLVKSIDKVKLKGNMEKRRGFKMANSVNPDQSVSSLGFKYTLGFENLVIKIEKRALYLYNWIFSLHCLHINILLPS